MTNLSGKTVLVALIAAFLSQSSFADWGRPGFRPGNGPGREHERPGYGRPGWNEPRRPVWICETSGGDDRRFYGQSENQGEAQRQAFVACDSAGHTGHRSCQRNMNCYVR